MPRNLIPQEPLEWRAMRHQERLPPRSRRWDGIGDVICWAITAVLIVLAGIGLRALLDPPKPQPFQPPSNVSNMKPGDTRDLGGGWSVKRVN